MEGSAAVYAMTNYWEKLNMQLEIKQGKNLVEAAKAAKVEHFIFSSLLNITKRKSYSCPVCGVAGPRYDHERGRQN